MRKGAVFLALALASCGGLQPTQVSRPISSGSAADPAIASEQLKQRGVIGPLNEQAERTKQPKKPVVEDVDTIPSRTIRYIEFTIDQTDPDSQKKLAKYLLNLNKYHIIQVTQTSPTTKYWKFMVVEDGTEASNPQLDLPVEVELDD